MGRASQKDAAENRARVVAKASTLIRERGVEGLHIDELMREAGLTRGGFYKMFGSKEALYGQACARAFEAAQRTWTSVGEGSESDRLERLVKFYLEPKPPGGQCPMTTLAQDVARADGGSPLRQAFTSGMRDLIEVVAGDKPTDHNLAVFAAMVGALLLRRASDDTEITGKIELAVVRLASKDR